MRQFFEKHPVPQDMQAAAHAFRISDKADARDIQDIHALLKAYNLSHREPSENVPLGVYLEDAEGRKSAGSTGETFGSRLLEAAEKEARRRGCRYAFVDTFSFQAPAFYKKHGYAEVFTLEDYPYTEKRPYFTKELQSLEEA